jgi:hypothetical protein
MVSLTELKCQIRRRYIACICLHLACNMQPFALYLHAVLLLAGDKPYLLSRHSFSRRPALSFFPPYLSSSRYFHVAVIWLPLITHHSSLITHFFQRDRPKFVGTKDRQAAKFVGGLKIRDGASEGQTTHITHHPPPLSRYCIVRYHHLAIITKISP